MAIYLKKFGTISQYNAYTADTTNFILPNVSLTVDNNTVHYNPSMPVPPTPTHDFVEIGGVKWATMNVGANSITDTGLYFQWGDTQGYTADQVGDGEGLKYFDWEDYKYAELDPSGGNGSGSGSGSGGGTYKMTKYNETDGKTVLEASDDAVTSAWGGNWRTPTTEEYVALGNAVNTAWTADYQGSGVKGLVCTDKTDSSKTLFFPACGVCGDGSVSNVSNGTYWSSSLNSSKVQNAYLLLFHSSYVYWQGDSYRYYGLPVRGIMIYYVVAKFNVTSTSQPTQIIGEEADSSFSKIEIDGVVQPSVASVYTFSTTGEHTVKYTLTDPTSISDSAFTNCTSLTSITIPNSVTSIGEYAFSSCSGLTSVNIPSGVTSISDDVFEYCTSLSSVTIPNSVTYIGWKSFYQCSGLTSCTIGSGVTTIERFAFEGCSSLTSIDIPDSVIIISGYSFTSCSGLTSVTIGSGVTTIGGYAFAGCDGLTSVNIPSGVTRISDAVFTSCYNLTSITVNSSNTVYDSRDNCNAIIETATNTLVAGCKNTVIPNSITTIGNYAFSHCSGLTSVTIPNSVTSIGWGAFGYCEDLTSVTIPNSVTSIANNSFRSCSGLTNITIGSSVTSIGDYAFSYCGNLSSIISNAMTAPTIQSDTFYNIHSNGTLTVQSGSSGYDVWMGSGDSYLGKYNWTKVEQ